jgi:hypothetical protein
MRRKLMMLAGMTVVVMSAAALMAAPSFALFTVTTTECKNEGVASVCIGNSAGVLFEASGTEELGTVLLVAGTTAILTVPEIPITILCTAATVTGEVSQTLVLVEAAILKSVVITFTGCTVDEQECKVEGETVKTKEIVGEAENTLNEGAILFKPATKTTFAEIKLEGEKCKASLVGANPVKGEQLATLLTSEDKEFQVLKATAAGSSLTFGNGGAPATFAAEAEISLKDKSLWDYTLA